MTTTTTISPTRYDRIFQATALAALVVAVVALMLALANRPAAAAHSASSGSAAQPQVTAETQVPPGRGLGNADHRAGDIPLVVRALRSRD